MARIAQIQVSYSPLEDRLLLRMSTEERSELRFWLTRRYVKLLAPVLRGAAERSGRGAMIPDSEARRTVAEFERGEALAKADFDTDFQADDAELPLGEEPVLLARIRTSASPTGSQVLSMHPLKGAGVDLVLDAKLIHSLIRLLEEGVRSAEWRVAELTRPAAPAPDATDTPRVLN